MKTTMLSKQWKENPTRAKIWVLRLILVSFFITAAVLITCFAYLKASSIENNEFVSRYHVLSNGALKSVVNSFDRMNVGIQDLAIIYAQIFPDANDWPNVAWRGFHPTSARLGKVSDVKGMAILPIVRPHQVDSYEAFINAYYDRDPYITRSAIFPTTFPNGTIWHADMSSFPYLQTADRFGNSTDSPNQILTPMAQYTVSGLAGVNLGSYNVHTNPLYTNVIDSVIECQKQHSSHDSLKCCAGISLTSGTPARTRANPSPVVTDMMAIFVRPILPADNQTVLAGFAVGTISWLKLLSNIFPEDVVGVDCVVETDSQAFTFHIDAGVPVLTGMGDLHDPAFSKYRSSSKLVDASISVSHSSTYTLSFYPTEEFKDSYMTFNPVRGALVLGGVFLFCTLVFVLYDTLNRREADRNQAVLDTKRRFVRFISHEIRTPLSTVQMGMKLLEVEMQNLGLVIANLSPGEVRRVVKEALCTWKTLAEEIVDSSASAVEVLNDLLNYDKIEVGTLKLEFTYFNVRDLVERTVSTMQAQARQKEVSLLLDCHWARSLLSAPLHEGDQEEDGGMQDLPCEDDRTVVGDAVRMGQVLRNLVSNALKFTPTSGTVHVTVEVLPTWTPLTEKVRASTALFQTMVQAGTVRIAVKDSGAGLSQHQLEQICAEGVQFNANELQAGQGSGLGLFISKGIVEQHGGRLTVTSEGLDRGATFIAELPLFQFDWGSGPSALDTMLSLQSRASVDEGDASAGLFVKIKPTGSSPLQCSPRPPSPRPTQHLLVVDDSPFNRKMVVRLLTTVGHTCVQAEDGQVALRQYKEMLARGEAPDAILMDFEMPVLNGPTATARLRELGYQGLVVGVTGNVLPADVALFKKHGADAVLCKPLVLEDLQALLCAAQAPLSAKTSSLCTEDRTAPRAAVCVPELSYSSRVQPFDMA